MCGSVCLDVCELHASLWLRSVGGDLISKNTQGPSTLPCKEPLTNKKTKKSGLFPRSFWCEKNQGRLLWLRSMGGDLISKIHSPVENDMSVQGCLFGVWIWTARPSTARSPSQARRPQKSGLFPQSLWCEKNQVNSLIKLVDGHN